MMYSEERRQVILRKLLAPHNRTVCEVAREEGICEATLYNWRKAARGQGQLLPDRASDSEGWSSQDKFNAVLDKRSIIRG